MRRNNRKHENLKIFLIVVVYLTILAGLILAILAEFIGESTLQSCFRACSLGLFLIIIGVCAFLFLLRGDW